MTLLSRRDFLQVAGITGAAVVVGSAASSAQAAPIQRIDL